MRGPAERSAPQPSEPFRIPLWLGFCLFLGVALFFLWEEHSAHILGVLPYAVFLLCPLIHLLMHRRHGDHTRSGPEGHDRHHSTGGRS